MKDIMASSKSEGKRSIVEENDGSRTRRKSTDDATSKLGGFSLRNSVDLMKDSMASSKSKGKRSIVEENDGSRTRRNSIDGAVLKLGGISLHNSVDLMKDSMTSAKSKCKRPIVEENDGCRTRRKFADGATLKLGGFSFHNSVDLMKDSMASAKSKGKRSIVDENDGSRTRRKSIDGATLKLGGISLHNSVDLMKDSMASSKSKCKRPIVDENDGSRTRRKSADGATCDELPYITMEQFNHFCGEILGAIKELHGGFPLRNSVDLMKDSMAGAKSKGKRSIVEENDGSQTRRKSIDGSTLKIGGISLHNSVDLVKDSMASAKSKGKRPIDQNDGSWSRTMSTDGATGKLGGRARTNNLSKAQWVRVTNNAKDVDVKVPAEKSRAIGAMMHKDKMVQNDEPLNKHDDEMVIMKEELKSVKDTVLSRNEKFANFGASLMELKQQITPSHFKGSYSNPSKTEIWKSAKSEMVYAPFICEICAEQKTVHKSFRIKGCSHMYCTDCVVKYVAAKLQENITEICCPVADCGGLLEPDYCRDILPQDVFDRWGTALCEAVIPGAQKFYCPFKDCSAMLIDDGGEVIREAECPNCKRLFCAQCQVPWHSEIKCVEFQKLNKDEREREDILLMNVAKKEKWKRCPNCRYYVEKKDGCMYMRCRCGTAFCYRCGNASDSFNDQYHYCRVCQC